MMRRLALLSLFLILSTAAKAQVLSSATATITDPASNAYVNGSYVITFNGPPSAKSNGQTFTQSFSGTLNASGAFGPVLLADNNSVSPGGTQWQFIICTYLGSPCFTASVTVTGPSPSLSAALSAFAPAVTQGIPSGIARGPAAQLSPNFGIFQPALQIQSNTGQVSPVIQVTDPTGKNLWLLGTSGAMNGVTLTSGTTAPGSCTPPALFFVYPAGTPNFCSGGTFVAFGTSTGAAITGSPVAGNLAVFSAANSITNGNLSADCTTSGGTAITCTKTAGVAFAPSATTDTTNAGNITAGNLNLARLPAGLNSPVSGGLLSATSGSTYAWTNALGLGLPVIGQGSGVVPTTGTVSGNTTKFVTESGSITPGNVPKVDGSGNLIESGTLPGTAATAVPVNVANDSPGVASTPGGTVTLNLGSAIIPTVNQFASSAVGAIFQFNSGTNPIFRTVILAVGTNQITVFSPWPGTNATVANPDNTTTGTPASGNWNMISDGCAPIEASIINHLGLELDASGIQGAVTCSVNPFAGAANRQGGYLWTGKTKFTSWREWTPPSFWQMYGSGRGNWDTGTANVGTKIIADTTNFPKQNSESVTNASTVTVTAGSQTFTDSGAGVTGGPPPLAGTPPFQSPVATAACDGTGFGHLTLTAAANGYVIGGLVEGQNIVLSGFINTATVWNASLLITGVSGPNIEVQFGANNCVNPAGNFAAAVANTMRRDFLQGSYTGNTTGVAGTTSVQTPCLAGTPETNPPFSGGCIEVTDVNSAGLFLSTDVNSCTLTATSSFSKAGPFTIAEFIDSNHVNIFTAGQTTGDPVWAASALTKTCYFQSSISAVTSATTLTATNTLQSSNIGNVSYNIAPPVMGWSPFGSGNGQTFALYATKLYNFSLSCNQIIDCVAFQNVSAQEQSSLDNLELNYTAIGLDTESGHNGPYTNLNIDYNSGTNITPLSSCITIWTGQFATVTRGIDSFTCTVGGSVMPWASVDVEGNRATIRNGHHEGYVNAYVFCQYSTASCKGDYLEGPEPGVTGYNDVLIPNVNSTQTSTEGLVIIGHFNNNAPLNAMIDDHTTAPNCGAGRSLIFGTNAEMPVYILGSTAPATTGHRYRFTTGYGADSCFGNSNTSNGSSTLNAQYFKASSQVLQVTGANVTCGTGGTLVPCTSLTTIPGLTWTSPTQSAQNWSFDCKILYSQATANAANQFGIQWATTAPTNWTAAGELQLTAATAAVPGTPVVNQNVTTATSLVTGTPTSAVGTVYQAHLWGTAELPVSSTVTTVPVLPVGAPVLNIMVLTGAAADLLTIYRDGSGCTIW